MTFKDRALTVQRAGYIQNPPQVCVEPKKYMPAFR